MSADLKVAKKAGWSVDHSASKTVENLDERKVVGKVENWVVRLEMKRVAKLVDLRVGWLVPKMAGLLEET